MRILQINSASSIGGGERHVADLSKALLDRGHDVYFAVRPASPIRPLLERFAETNFLYAKIRNPVDVISARHIGQFAAEIEAEVIHAHIARDFTIAAEASRVSGVPFVLTRHTLFPMSRIHRLALRRISAVIAPSAAVKASLEKSYIFPALKIRLVHNGIDTDHFSAAEDLPQRPLTIGSIGHLGPIKGFDTFVRSAAMLSEAMPDARFVIFGEDKSRDGRNRTKLARLIADLGAPVELLGWRDDAAAAYREIDIFVSAARSEPFGLVIAEAMSAGLPVIATRSEGASEIVVDGSSGRLIPIADPEAMAKAISELAADSEMRGSLGTAGRQRIIEHFSLAKMADETAVLYASVTESARAA